MNKLLGAVVALSLVIGAGTASAQTCNTATHRIRMVLAHCTTGPCDPFYTFQGGSTLIKRGKQPRLVTNRKIGKIRVNSLQSLGGPPVPLSLDARLSGTIFYGADGGAACPLANTVVSGPFATSTMTCTFGPAGDANCSGNIFFINFTDPECSDVSQVIQDINIDVFEGGFEGVPERKIATGGMNILGRSPDCASGGAGCP